MRDAVVVTAYDRRVFNEYRFVYRWLVRAPEATYDVIGDTVGYPRWWGDAFASVEGDAGPHVQAATSAS